MFKTWEIELQTAERPTGGESVNVTTQKSNKASFHFHVQEQVTEACCAHSRLSGAVLADPRLYSGTRQTFTFMLQSLGLV
jgi:hypothetical protein